MPKPPVGSLASIAIHSALRGSTSGLAASGVFQKLESEKKRRGDSLAETARGLTDSTAAIATEKQRARDMPGAYGVPSRRVNGKKAAAFNKADGRERRA